MSTDDRAERDDWPDPVTTERVRELIVLNRREWASLQLHVNDSALERFGTLQRHDDIDNALRELLARRSHDGADLNPRGEPTLICDECSNPANDPTEHKLECSQYLPF